MNEITVERKYGQKSKYTDKVKIEEKKWQYARVRVTDHRISSVIMKMLFYKVKHLLMELKHNPIHDGLFRGWS